MGLIFASFGRNIQTHSILSGPLFMNNSRFHDIARDILAYTAMVISVAWLLFFILISSFGMGLILLDADPSAPFTQYMRIFNFTGPIVGFGTGLFAVTMFADGKRAQASKLIWLITTLWLLASFLGSSHAEAMKTAADCQGF